MNTLRNAQLLGWILVGLGAAQLVPVATALLLGESSLPYLASAIVAAVCGLPVALGIPPPAQRRMRARDGFTLAVGAWLLASVFGAVPYFTALELHPADALFESVAGFTTTAASAVPSPEVMPRPLLVWRAMSQWIGGLGTLAIAVALLPFLEIGGMQLFSSDTARSASGAGRPPASHTLVRVFAVYAGLTLLVLGALALAGMDGIDASCHAMTSVSTGGFSTRAGSIASFRSGAVEWVLVVAMFVSAMNFVLLYRLATGLGDVRRDGELRYYVGAVAVAGGLLWFALMGEGRAPDAAPALRAALFQAVSMLSGTGYTSEDYRAWTGFAQLVLVMLMVLGGMSGSTTGGLRSLRLLISFRALVDSFTRLLHPHAVARVKYAGDVVPARVLSTIWAFLTAFFLVAAAASALLAAAGYELVSAASAGLSLTANVGPALGEAGPGTSFASLPGAAKLGLALCMLAGRLDVFILLVVFQPRFWRA